MLYRLALPPGNERGPHYAAQLYRALHSALGREVIELRWTFAGPKAAIRSEMRCGRQIGLFAGRLLTASYPGTRLRTERGREDSRTRGFQTRWLRLEPDVLAMASLPEFEDRLAGELADPLTGLLSALGACQSSEAVVAIVLQRAPLRRIERGRRLLARHQRLGDWRLRWALSPRFWQRLAAWLPATPSPGATTRHEATTRKVMQPCFEARVRLEALGADRRASTKTLDRLEAAFAAFASASEARWVRARRRDRGSLLLSEEAALLWRPWTTGVKAERLEVSAARELEPPTLLLDTPNVNDAALGRTRFRDRRDLVAIPLDDRRRHLYVVGKTGTGKSTLLLNLVAGDLAAGHGLALLDPHGDLIEEALERVPRRRTNDVELFDPAAGGATFNPLACHDPSQRSLVAASVQAALAKVFELTPADAPRLLYILQNVLLALVEHPGTTLLDVPRMLTDERFRRVVVGKLSNELVLRFWREEFAGWNDRYRTEAIAPIQNKVGQLLADERLRAVFAAPTGSLNIRQAMDRGQAVLCNLSYGRLGEPAAKLLGALLVSQIQLDALARADTPEKERRDFFVYADEFQGYAGVESLEVILSQARKYRVSLTLANQLVGQMVKESPSLAATVFGNVGSLCVLQVGHEDALKLADELGGEVTPEDLITIPKHTAAVRLLVDGEPTRPFTIRTLPPPPVKPSHAHRSTIERASRRRASRGQPKARPAAERAKRRRRSHRRPAAPSGASAAG